MDLSIIIVNWNSAHYLPACLSSVYANLSTFEFEVIVIDNASYDGADRLIQAQFPTVKFVQGTENLGFAKANNVAFRHSRGRVILFLNPDTEVIGQAISTMYRALHTIPHAAIVGCRLLNSDRTVQTSCILRFPSISTHALDSDFLRRRLPELAFWGTRPLTEQPTSPVSVEAVSGACLMVRRDAFEQVGLFTPDYKMYVEDVDLCYKVRELGRKVYHVGAATVIHHGGGSTLNSEHEIAGAIQIRQSQWLFIYRNYGRAYACAYKVSVTVSALGRLALLVLARPFITLAGLGSDLGGSVRKWRRILLWAISLGS